MAGENPVGDEAEGDSRGMARGVGGEGGCEAGGAAQQEAPGAGRAGSVQVLAGEGEQEGEDQRLQPGEQAQVPSRSILGAPVDGLGGLGGLIC